MAKSSNNLVRFLSGNLVLLLLVSSSVLSVHGVDLGETCVDDTSCTVTESKCIDEGGTKTCQCNDGFVGNAAKDTCLTIELIGQPCVEDVQCVENSECKDDGTAKTCQCKPEYVENGANDECLLLTELIGGPCRDNSHCELANSECAENEGEKTCECTDGWIANAAKGVCLKVADGVDGPCVESQQCSVPLGDLSRCEAEKCECYDTEHPDEVHDTKLDAGKCVHDLANLGEACETKLCGAEHSECEDTEKICQCADTYIRDEARCLPIMGEVGGDCIISEQCTDQTYGLGVLSRCEAEKCECYDTVNPDEPRDTEVKEGKCVITTQGGGGGAENISVSAVMILAGVIVAKIFHN